MTSEQVISRHNGIEVCLSQSARAVNGGKFSLRLPEHMNAKARALSEEERLFPDQEGLHSIGYAVNGRQLTKAGEMINEIAASMSALHSRGYTFQDAGSHLAVVHADGGIIGHIHGLACCRVMLEYLNVRTYRQLKKTLKSTRKVWRLSEQQQTQWRQQLDQLYTGQRNRNYQAALETISSKAAHLTVEQSLQLLDDIMTAPDGSDYSQMVTQRTV